LQGYLSGKGSSTKHCGQGTPGCSDEEAGKIGLSNEHMEASYGYSHIERQPGRQQSQWTDSRIDVSFRKKRSQRPGTYLKGYEVFTMQGMLWMLGQDPGQMHLQG